MSGWLSWGGPKEEPPKSWWQELCDGWSLSYYQRLIGFAISFGVGLFFCVMVRAAYAVLACLWR